MNRVLLAMSLSVLVMITYQVFSTPVQSVSSTPIGEANATSPVYSEVTLATLKEIVAKSGKPTLIMVYASWCPYCQKQWPIFQSLKASYKDKAQIMELSIDQDTSKLAAFLSDGVHTSKHSLHLATEDHDALGTWLSESGGNYSGGIPYLVLFDKKGTFARDFLGMREEKVLSAALDSLIQ